jgi:hypothetical protein
MRLHLLIRSAALLVIAAAPLALRAQFQDPTPEELKMTSDPKAPGAPAVYLYREEITEGANGLSTIYARIKVLTEKGKEFPFCAVRPKWKRWKGGPFALTAL